MYCIRLGILVDGFRGSDISYEGIKQLCGYLVIHVFIFQVNGQAQAKNWATVLTKGLKKRSLCETATTEQTVTVNLYELVKQSISRYREQDTEEQTRQLFW